MKWRSAWPIFHGPVILPYILKTIWCMNIILWEYESVWPDFWPQNKCRSLWPILHGPVICLISWRLFDVWTSYFGIMRQYDTTLDLKINVGHYDLYFIVQWICLIYWRLFAVWTSYFGIMSRYNTTFDILSKCRSLWPIFHGPVILPYVLNSNWWMNVILLENESV